MFDLIQKMLYAAVGTIAVTEEKARELVAELEKKGAVTTEEGKKLVKEIVEKGRNRSEELHKKIEDAVAKAINRVRLAKDENLQAVKKQLAELAEKVSSLLNK